MVCPIPQGDHKKGRVQSHFYSSTHIPRIGLCIAFMKYVMGHCLCISIRPVRLSHILYRYITCHILETAQTGRSEKFVSRIVSLVLGQTPATPLTTQC